MTLELTPEQEAKLRAQAEALELTLDGYLRRLAGLDDGTQPQGEAPNEEAPEVIPPGQSLADALAGRIGTVNSAERNGGQVSRLSENTGQAFTEYLLGKQRQGRL